MRGRCPRSISISCRNASNARAVSCLSALEELDLSPIHLKLRAERGRPPYHPKAMVGLLLCGACRGIYSSRQLEAACRDHIAFRYLMAGIQPDFHTICEFRQRFEAELRGLFSQVLQMCRRAGLVRLGHVALDGTKVRANASKHKAMSYERLLAKRKSYEEEIEGWFKRARDEDAAEDEAYGPDDDGWSLPEGWEETLRRLSKVEDAQARLEEEAKEKVVRAGKDPSEAGVHPKAQANFTDPDSRELSADAGYASESNFQALDDAGVYGVIALRRYRCDEPPDADPAPARSSNRWPQR